jgi:hypothetical protein
MGCTWDPGAPSTSCSYDEGVNDDWSVNWFDNCSITTNLNLDGGNITITNGNGSFTLKGGNLTNVENVLMIGDGNDVSFMCQGGCILS